MKILVSNDDGYRAEGIARLREVLSTLGEVTVVAPDRNRSGAGNSLTLDAPLRLMRFRARVCTSWPGHRPTACTWAITGALDIEFDMVASGINDGANLGDDVLYSGHRGGSHRGTLPGTAGAGVFALHLARRRAPLRHRRPRGAKRWCCRCRSGRWIPTLILNVNVPDLPFEALEGYRSTRLGFRHRSEAVIPARDPRGNPVYWIGPAGAGNDAGQGTDFKAVADGFVSVTPLSIDFTRHAALPERRALARCAMRARAR